MRRQTKSKAWAARWAVSPINFDPFHLPVRYSVPLDSVPGRHFGAVDDVFLRGRSVLVRRKVFGKTVFAKRISLSEFDGVSISIAAHGDDESDHMVSVNLRHKDEKLCVPLYMAFDLEEAGARWQALGRSLQLPLMVPTPDGSFSYPFKEKGLQGVYEPISRPASVFLASRRPRMMKFRSVGEQEGLRIVAGAEIIARD